MAFVWLAVDRGVSLVKGCEMYSGLPVVHTLIRSPVFETCLYIYIYIYIYLSIRLSGSNIIISRKNNIEDGINFGVEKRGYC